jgi:hypothetical protein
LKKKQPKTDGVDFPLTLRRSFKTSPSLMWGPALSIKINELISLTNLFAMSRGFKTTQGYLLRNNDFGVPYNQFRRKK